MAQKKAAVVNTVTVARQRMKKRLLCKRKETGDMRLGFFTLRGESFCTGTFGRLCSAQSEHICRKKRELFGKIKAARGADG